MYHAKAPIRDESRVNTEKEKVRVVLRHCRYIEWALNEGEQLGKRQNRREEEVKELGDNYRQEEKPKKAYVVLLYMKSVMERLQTVYKKHDIRLFCKAWYTIKNVVVCLKGDPMDLEEKCASLNSVDSCMWTRWRDLQVRDQQRKQCIR